jgi:hypothetical protein
MRLGIDDDSFSDSMLMILNAGGSCWEDEDSDTVEEALAKAEEY